MGAGVSSVLFMLTLRRIHTEDLRIEALEQETKQEEQRTSADQTGEET